jgi:hypothetical protein
VGKFGDNTSKGRNYTMEEKIKSLLNSDEYRIDLSLVKEIVDKLGTNNVTDDCIKDIIKLSEKVFHQRYAYLFEISLEDMEVSDIPKELLNEYITDKLDFRKKMGINLTDDDTTIEDILLYILQRDKEKYYELVSKLITKWNYIKNIRDFYEDIAYCFDNNEFSRNYSVYVKED